MNGGGWTRTLLAWPDPARWVARISVADVEQAGPFSVFPGVDRWFAVLEGDGLRLTLRSNADLLGCFVCDDAELTIASGEAPEKSALSRFSLAWLENPARETLALRLSAPVPRGWWIEVEGTGR